MSEQTNQVFEGIFAYEEIREILRESAPKHELDENQKERLEKALKKIDSSLKNMKRLL
jgi:hypothetical protein